MNLRPLPVLILLVFSIFAAGWTRTRTNSGADLYWSDWCQVMLVNERGCDQIAGDAEFVAVREALARWNEVECSGWSMQYGGETNQETTGHVNEKPSANMIVWRQHGWPYAERPVAFAAVTYNAKTGEIYDADIEFNGEDYELTVTPAREPWKIDLENALVHELGHLAGLDHSDDPGATMFGRADPGEVSKRTLAPDDIDGLCAIMPPKDESCPAVTPEYHYFAPPDPEEESGCGIGSTVGGAHALALLVVLLLAVRLRARVVCRAWLLVALVVGWSDPAAACSFYRTQGGDPLHWHRLEVGMWVDGSGLDELPEAEGLIAGAMGRWNALGCPLTLQVAGVKEGVQAAFDKENLEANQNHIVFIHQGWMAQLDGLPAEEKAALDDAIAFTRLSFSNLSGELLDADILVNGEAYWFADCEAGGGEVLDFQDFRFVMLHELGHVVGLDHSYEGLAVMAAQSGGCNSMPPLELAYDDGECFKDYYCSPQFLADCAPPEEPIESVAADLVPDSQGADGGPTVAEGGDSPGPDCGSCAASAGSGGAGLGLSLALLFLWLLRRRTLRTNL